MDILVSFIIVTYKRSDLLKQCLESIYMQQNLPEPYEIIIVDNGGDAVIDPPPHANIHQRIAVSGENLGAVGGRNQGMKLARGRFWVIIDDDAVWHDANDASRMVTMLQNDDSIGAIAVKSLAPDGNPIMVEYPHPNKTYIAAQKAPVDVPYFYTMGMSLRADVVHQVGDYPERFRIYMEEVDLSYRLLDAGYRIVYAPDVAVYHHRSNLGRVFKEEKYWYQNALNKCRMAWRLLPLPYPLTIGLIWSGAILLKTRRIGLIWQMWQQLWHERALLAEERNTLKPETIKYLRRIGARILY